MNDKCKLCNSKILIDTVDGCYCSSDYVEGIDICKSCLIEHCVATNCLGCDLRKYSSCEFLEQKQYYLNND